MKILMTNDDGINAEGLNVLFDVISRKHEVCMIAPDVEKSACSNAFTIHSGVVVKKESENRFAVSGYPSDCVSVGLHSDLCFDPELIISGINHGPNVGDDLFFSGTVAGARSGFIFGKSSLAFSIDSHHKSSKYFMEASEFLLDFIDSFIKELSEEILFFNINYPDLPKEKISGMKYTFSGKRIYKDTYKIKELSDDTLNMELTGEIGSVKIDGSDVTELEKGYISITPLNIDTTDYSLLEKLKSGKYDNGFEVSGCSGIA